MPKKRKIEDIVKEEMDSAEDDDEEEEVDAIVKVEQLSQEGNKGSPSPCHHEDGCKSLGRALRPRKNTCYTERDSPEPEFDEKRASVMKGIRKKRRWVSSENEAAPEDKEGAIHSEHQPARKRHPRKKKTESESNEDKTKDEGRGSDEAKEQAAPTSVTEKKEDGDKVASSVPTTKAGPSKKSLFRGRRPKISAPIETKEIIPKKEVTDPADIQGVEHVEKLNTSEDKTEKKRPPRKRPPRKKKSESNENTTTKDERKGSEETKEQTAPTPVTEKKEVEDRAASSVPTTKTIPLKKPLFRGRRPKVSAPTETTEIIPKKEVIDPADIQGVEHVEKLNTSEDKTEKKRLPRKRPPRKKKSESNENTTTKDEGKGSDDTKEQTAPAPSSVAAKKEDEDRAASSVPMNTSTPLRRPFFRGRRSKISARTGRKEIIHKEEAIDPADIQGFEHVEKYSTPPGIRLPKFWDSEDELSDDDNNDNFRRIMCGFGTNCRIHEVIRPASEIVRRLKELQNTFGASKTLPLFQLDGSTAPEPGLDDAGVDDSVNKNPIVWHNDPRFFQYANNFP